MSLKVYAYKKCSTCRKAIRFLEEHKIDFKQIDITQTPPTKTEIQKMIRHLDGEVKPLFNTSGVVYREQGLKDVVGTMTEKEAVAMLSSNGKLVKRPFVLLEDQGLLGFKEQEWQQVFS